jgi:putative addiction module component (TIGR02574 family)
MADLDELKREVECLSADDRELLLFFLWELLDRDRDPDYDEAWAAEIERRVREVKEGSATLVSADEVLARLRAQLQDS